MAARGVRNNTMFKIEREYIYGWDDLCSDHVDEYPTIREAQDEIDDAIKSVNTAIEAGDMVGPPETQDDYRIVPTTGGVTQSGMKLGDHESDITGFLGEYFNDRHNKILHADVEEVLVLAIRGLVDVACECEPEMR